MHTPALPTSPASHTRALWPTDPAPAYWPTLTNATQPAPRYWLIDAAAASDDGARVAADLRYTRRMVAELVAIEGVRA